MWFIGKDDMTSLGRVSKPRHEPMRQQRRLRRRRARREREGLFRYLIIIKVHPLEESQSTGALRRRYPPTLDLWPPAFGLTRKTRLALKFFFVVRPRMPCIKNARSCSIMRSASLVSHRPSVSRYNREDR